MSEQSSIEPPDIEPISTEERLDDFTESVQKLSEATGRPSTIAEIAREYFAKEPDGYWTPTEGYVFTGRSDLRIAGIIAANSAEKEAP